jgi:cysteinyl-tRNA synthetase
VQLRLHNTLTRTKEAFEPIDPSRVRLYNCGPTIYQRIHVGNARSFVVFDVLYRLLRHLYGADNIVYVRNITDIDDKIIDQARKDGVGIRELTERTTAQFHEDLAALGCLPPIHEPRATEHVPGMVALIGKLIERGHAYAADGHVLFSVPSTPTYGRLSGRNREEQIAGARVDVAPYKRDPADFVLWKPSTGDQPGWDSPWGHGRPGWHIECSAMSERYLGPLPFDIHAGGLDLIFPHHENEIAQSCCAHGIEQMARFWLHNGFLDMRGEKMSKSLGNVVGVPDALALAPAEAVRLHLLATHYRQPAEFSEEGLAEAHQVLDRAYRSLESAGLPYEAEPDSEFLELLTDDVNTPSAMARLHALIGDVNKAVSEGARKHAASILYSSAGLLGLLRNDDWFGRKAADVGRISALVEERRNARAKRDFARADSIRAALEAEGITLDDKPDGRTEWHRRRVLA